MDVLITEEMEAPAFLRLNEHYQVAWETNLWREPGRLKATIPYAKVLMVRNQTQVTADVLDAATELKAVVRVGVGLDNIDVPAATQRGIVVVAPLDANAGSVAELTMAFILALARKIVPGDRATKAGKWDRKSCTGFEIDGKTITICGFGRIGRLVAARARAFGMKIVVYDPFVKPGAESLKTVGAVLCESLEGAVSLGDFVSSHSPLTPETKHMFNAGVFKAMKQGAYFINTSRGGVVDEAALYDALKRGHLGGAALDVREKEPPVTRLGFEDLDNIILAPHIGAFTVEAQNRTAEAVVADTERLLQGKAAVNFVNFAEPRRKQ
ncbi:MAG: hydroxyacid dehydrogenase [Verrucomicrobiota bacterium]